MNRKILRSMLLYAALLGVSATTDVLAASRTATTEAAHGPSSGARHAAPAQKGAQSGAQSTAKSGPININTADAQAIADGLQGIGLSKAQLIVAYRKEHGKFDSADQLGEVKGIGKKTVDKNRPRIVVK